MIKVKVVEFDGVAAVVQYEGKRVVIPRDLIDSTRRCEREVLECGIPYGVDFEALLEGVRATTGADIARELHKMGIWTIEDVLVNSVRVRQAINIAHGTVLAQVLNRVRALKK